MLSSDSLLDHLLGARPRLRRGRHARELKEGPLHRATLTGHCLAARPMANMLLSAVVAGAAAIGCGAQPTSPIATGSTPDSTANPATQAATEVDSGVGPPSIPVTATASDVVDVAVHAIGRNQAGRTTALHDMAPTSAFTIIVHAPSTEDIRYFRHASMLDVVFHPHDQAPDVLYVFSSPSQSLKYRAGRHEFQVDADDAKTLQTRFGDFAVLVLDAKGRLLGAFSEPVLRGVIHELVGHRDGKDTAPRAAPPPRP